MNIVVSDHSSALLFVAFVILVSVVSGCDKRDNYDFDYDIRETETAFAYRNSSPYAGNLKKCVLVNTVAESCTLYELPLIGDGVTTPTVDQIMDRLLVTHSWMGARFEEVLRDAPESLLSLFSSSTAILVGSKVRPSFYTRLNGAIQLDPVYLWTTTDEKSSISKEEDFRSDYGKDLQFWFLSRQAKPDGSRLAPFYSLNDSSERSIEHVIPRHKIATINTELSIYETIDSIRDEWLSNTLQATHPLTSETLREFAKVRYRGNEASATQKSTNSADMGALMAVDGAIKFYSYSSQHEDLAQLVEGVMMGYHFDSLTNIGFSQKPFDENNYTCDDLLVDWGQRNRLGDPLVNVRARAATELVVSLTPAITSFMDNRLGDAELMINKIHWCNNQKINTDTAFELQSRSVEPVDAHLTGPQFREMMHTDSIVHPDGLHQD